ncbi:MAG: type II toxin-antitoxin system death-on-curing family toxin [Acidobacteriaceae bacterium]
MTVPAIRWVTESAVLAVHDEQLAEHGGAPGIRNNALLLAALAHPRNLAAAATPDLAELAAAYAVGLARNHPFVAGNKRTALAVAAGVFLPLNGYELTATNKDMVRVMLAVADGTLPEIALAAGFRQWKKPLPAESRNP